LRVIRFGARIAAMPDGNGNRMGHVIVAGFGVPGRVVADLLEKHGVPYCVVETESQDVRRLNSAASQIHAGA
jgi:voltage-gated potassium channel Kch